MKRNPPSEQKPRLGGFLCWGLRGSNLAELIQNSGHQTLQFGVFCGFFCVCLLLLLFFRNNRYGTFTCAFTSL